MVFVVYVSDKVYGFFVFNVWYFNKDIMEYGMGMGKEVWFKFFLIGFGEFCVYKIFNNIIF